MIQSSTSDQLLLLAYGELNDAEAAALRALIATDPAVGTAWDALKQDISNLPEMVTAPSETSLKIVLEHSYKTEHLHEI